jgi:hypothetical protein
MQQRRDGHERRAILAPGQLGFEHACDELVCVQELLRPGLWIVLSREQDNLPHEVSVSDQRYHTGFARDFGRGEKCVRSNLDELPCPRLLRRVADTCQDSREHTRDLFDVVSDDEAELVRVHARATRGQYLKSHPKRVGARLLCNRLGHSRPHPFEAL